MAHTVVDKCELCKSEEQVDFLCYTCDKILCKSCKVGHEKSRANENHDIKLLTKPKVVFCHEHSAVEITLFCLTCNQLICIQCVAEKHQRHQITSPDDMRDSNAKKLNENITKLKEKQSGYEKVFSIEHEIHSQVSKSIEQARKDISDQKAKIIKELDIVCNKQNDKLENFQKYEDKRYFDKCSEIQAQIQAVTSVIQRAEKSLESSSTAIIQTTVDTAKILNELNTVSITQAEIAQYQPGDRSHPTICGVQGKVNIVQSTTTQQPGVGVSYPVTPQVQDKINRKQEGAKPTTDALEVKLQENDTSDSSKHHSINKPFIDIIKAEVKSTIQFEDKKAIHVIVPLKDKTAWVKLQGQRQFSLVDSKGNISKKSVTVMDKEICDAKEYRDGLLVTCYDHCIVMKMSADGESISPFSNLSPNNTRGLCVTRDLETLVCLRSTTNKKDNMVYRLNSEGTIIQKIQHEVTGPTLYNDPWGIISLTTGEVIVVDKRKPRRIIGVDGKIQHLFTWEGEVQGRKLDKYSVSNITCDSNDNFFVTDNFNNRVFVLGKNGSEFKAKCLLDNTLGIYDPLPIAVDNEGQLWIGCSKGKIHIIQY